MPIFLFAALITLAVFEIVVLLWRTRIRTEPLRIVLYLCAGIIFPVLIVSLAANAILSAIIPPYGLRFLEFDILYGLYGKLFSSIVLGAAFGVVFGVLMNSILLGPREGPIPAKGKALLALLIALLVLGIGGERLIQDAGRRVTKLSFGGTEITLSEPAKQRRDGEEGDLTIRSYASSTVNAPSLPIELFYTLAAQIKRDQTYIVAAYKKSQPPKDVVPSLARAEAFARTVLAPIGHCLSTIFSQTGDIRYVKDGFAELLPYLSDVSLPQYSPTIFGEGSAAKFLSLMQRLYIYTYDRAYKVKIDDSKESPALKLKGNCLVVTYVLCSEREWKAKYDTVVSIEDIVDIDERTRLKLNADLTPPILAACHANAIHDRSPVIGNGPPGGTAGKINRTQGLRAELQSYLTQFAKDGAFRERPYLAIIVATILAQFGQEETALVSLENWLNTNEQWVDSHKDNSTASKWLRVRLLSVLTALTEQWILREGNRASLVLREYHISQLKLAVELVNDLFDMKTSLLMERHGLNLEKLENLGFSIAPPDGGGCPTRMFDDARQQKSLYAWYLSAQIRIASQRLKSPRYVTHHRPPVNAAIRELFDLNYGCTVDDAATVRTLRAESLRLYAQMQLQDVKADRNLKAKTILEKQLNSGVSAANLGLHLIADDAEAEIAERLKPTKSFPILDRLASTEAIEVYEGLLAVRSRMRDMLQEMDRN